MNRWVAWIEAASDDSGGWGFALMLSRFVLTAAVVMLLLVGFAVAIEHLPAWVTIIVLTGSGVPWLRWTIWGPK